MVDRVLQTELQAFEEMLGTLLREHEGQFVLFHGREYQGAYPSERDAERAGIRKNGLVPFLVKKVARTEEPARFATNIVRPPATV